VSIADEGIRPNLLDDVHDWVVFITDLEQSAYVAEFDVPRCEDLVEDAEQLADAVAAGITAALREGHIFLGEYRGEGRLSSGWFA